MKIGFNDLWPTKVLYKKLDHQDLIDQVCQDILRDRDPKDMPSDLQDFNLLEDGGKLYKQFREIIIKPCFDEYLKETFNKSIDYFPKHRFRGWLAGPNSGYAIPIHNHSGASISAVFYLFCEEANAGGELVLVDPRTNANRGYIDEMRDIFSPETLMPKSGTVVIFPSFLYHYTNMFRGNLRLAMPVDFFPDIDD